MIFEQSEIPDLKKKQLKETDKTPRKEKETAKFFAVDMQKYKLWKEQEFRCIYTGDIIKLSDLFDDNTTQIEHTIPRSISFNNSLSNRTVCFTYANKQKNNRIPSELSNYSDIMERIKPWAEKVEHIKKQIELWKGNTKTAATIERKNECIQQRHMWELELDYWQAKLRTFTIQKDELNTGFLNSQLVDTRIITKYAFHYLKSVFDRVDVQKGSVTATFRKILGVQSTDDKKDRSKHSHHAVDAAILTLIPTADKRDRMLELFYRLQETPDAEKHTTHGELKKLIASCRIGSIDKLVDTIERNILVNHISKDQTLTPAKKKRYIGRRKIKDQWLQGDSIRGSLHKDTFYGAIETHKDEIIMVIRKPLDSLGLKSNKPIKEYADEHLESIIDPTVRESISIQVKKYMQTKGVIFAHALKEPMYMLNKNGEPITHDKNGHPISPIRHVRCRAKAGVGYIKKETVLPIKEQTYLSNKDYKNQYYVQTDDNYLCLFYKGIFKGENKRAFRIINYFDISKLNITDTNALFSISEFSEYKQNPLIHLKAIIKKGTRVLFYNTYPEEVQDLDNDALSKRLYIVQKFNAAPTAYLYLYQHIEARDETKMDSSEKGKEYSPGHIPAYIRCKADNFKALIEHYDFEVDTLGNIIFK